MCLHFSHLKNFVSGSSPALVCCSQKYAFLCPHLGHMASVRGCMLSLSSTTSILSSCSTTSLIVSSSFSAVLNQQLQYCSGFPFAFVLVFKRAPHLGQNIIFYNPPFLPLVLLLSLKVLRMFVFFNSTEFLKKSFE